MPRSGIIIVNKTSSLYSKGWVINKQTNKFIIYFQLMLAAVKKNVVKRKSVMGEGCFEKREKEISLLCVAGPNESQETGTSLRPKDSNHYLLLPRVLVSWELDWERRNCLKPDTLKGDAGISGGHRTCCITHLPQVSFA